MNILVTGANGFIGRRLASRLIGGGHHVFGLSLKAAPDTPLGFKDYYLHDLAKPFSLKTSFDLVVHLAAYNITHVGTRDEGVYAAVNVEGTRNLLQGVHAKRFIYLSTVKVYKNEGLVLTEDSPLGPQGAYAQSKLKAEEVFRALLKKESLVILRSANVIGWGQAIKAVIPVFFQKARANQALDIIYSPHTLMQWVYVEDLVDAIEALIGHEHASGIFNIAHEETVSLERLARKIISMTRSSSVLNISPNASETVFSPVICDRAYQAFGWKAKTGLTEVLELYDQEYARSA